MTADGYTIAEYASKWQEVKQRSAKLEGLSLADRLSIVEACEPGFTGRLLDEIGPVGDLMLAYDKGFWLRPKQLAPFGALGLWRILLFVAGRRNGKTLFASEWIVDRLQIGAREMVIVGPTYDEAKQFMLSGHKRRVDAENGSGVLDVLPPWIRHHYKEDEGVIEFPDHKAVLRLWSGELSEYRGPGPDSVWGDELIKWRYPEKLLSNLRLACSSVGRVHPQLVLTTSPKKLRFLRDLVMEDDVVTLHATSSENRGNVSEGWFRSETKRLGGTAQGAEEMGGELGFDEEGAIFKLSTIDENRVDVAPPLDRIVVSVDPAASQHHSSDSTGIIVAGRAGDVHTGHGYLLEEATGRHAWEAWAAETWRLVEKFGASAIVLERNYGADSVASNIRTVGSTLGYEARPRPGFKTLIDMVHKKTGRVVQIVEILARGDKGTRARSTSTLYESKRFHHVGRFENVETEQTEWDPTSGAASPNGLDALVHASIELFALDSVPELSGEKAMAGFAAAQERLARAAPAQRMASGGRPKGFPVGGNRGRSRYI